MKDKIQVPAFSELNRYITANDAVQVELSAVKCSVFSQRLLLTILVF